MSVNTSLSCLLAAVTIFPSFVSAQDVVEKSISSAVVPLSETVELDVDGKLTGKVYLNQDGEQNPAAAKLTLTADGVVIDSVIADEEGNFAFANVAPGTYQMYGSADGYAGTGYVDAAAYSGGAVSSDYSMGLDSYSSDVAYDNYGGAPVQSFGSATCGGGGCSAGSCGGGGGGGLRRKLLWAGIGLGIVGIAGGFDGKDPASP